MFRLSEKGENIQEMFGSIAPRYDFLNRLLSFGIDRRWRQKAVRLVKYREGSRILDVATGTGDVALEIARSTPESVKITGADFCREMVELGQAKVATSPYAGRIDFKVAPCEDLPFRTTPLIRLPLPSVSGTWWTEDWGLLKCGGYCGPEGG
jgi:demethylmenaquinone methyltransferase / 2-methoxy-6-polyprenyl-1,4-benzoquinol methylase